MSHLGHCEPWDSFFSRSQHEWELPQSGPTELPHQMNVCCGNWAGASCFSFTLPSFQNVLPSNQCNLAVGVYRRVCLIITSMINPNLGSWTKHPRAPLQVGWPGSEPSLELRRGKLIGWRFSAPSCSSYTFNALPFGSKAHVSLSQIEYSCTRWCTTKRRLEKSYFFFY